MIGIFINNKNKKHYVVLYEVEDQTNGREGTPMYVYYPIDGGLSTPHVRTVEEFNVKFTPVTDVDLQLDDVFEIVPHNKKKAIGATR